MYICQRKAGVYLKKLILILKRLNHLSKPGFFTLVGFLILVLETLEGCGASGG